MTIWVSNMVPPCKSNTKQNANWEQSLKDHSQYLELDPPPSTKNVNTHVEITWSGLQHGQCSDFSKNANTFLKGQLEFLNAHLHMCVHIILASQTQKCWICPKCNFDICATFPRGPISKTVQHPFDNVLGISEGFFSFT